MYKVPDSWREGLHYTRSGKHVFSCAETVIALRSNGKNKCSQMSSLYLYVVTFQN